MTNFECYYCDFKTEERMDYQTHVLKEHYIQVDVAEMIQVGGKSQSLKPHYQSVLCYPGMADFNSENFKSVFPQARPKGKRWEK